MPAAITAIGLTEAQKRATERAQRLRDMSPAFRVIAQDLESEVQSAFRRSASPAGDKWQDIKESTKLGRQSVRKRAGKRGKGGSLTASAKKFRAALLAAGGSRPLMDTGRMRGSAHSVPGRVSVRFSMVGYTAPHIVGSAKSNLPKRNPTPFELAGTRWRLIPRLRVKYARIIADHIEGRR